MGGGSRKRRCADEGSKPGVFGLLTARAVPWYLSNQPLLCSWGLSVSGFVGDQNQCGIVRGWKSMDKEGGRAVVGERTEILEVHSRKKTTVHTESLPVKNLLAVWRVYHLLLGSNIRYSANIHCHIF